MSSIFDHLHIKRNTAGSSNELSFDVLDAARGDLDSKRGRQKQGPLVLRPVKQEAYEVAQPKTRKKSVREKEVKTPKPVKGSFHGVRGASSLSGENEVVFRKRQRRLHSVQLWAMAIVAVVAVIGASAYVSYDYYRDIQNFQSLFLDVVDGFVTADAGLPEIEKFVGDPFSSTEQQRKQIRSSADDAVKALANLEEQISATKTYAIAEDDSVVISSARSGADARKSMMAITIEITDIVDSSANETSEANAVWNDVLDADQLARSATSSANKASSDADIQASREQTAASLAKLKEARTALSKIDIDKLDIDLEMYKQYLDARIKALDCALATSDALLKGDKEEAARQNDSYNQLDEQAVEIAAQLPLSFETTVKDAVGPEINSLKQEYAKARDVAVDSDAFIRTYLSRRSL